MSPKSAEESGDDLKSYRTHATRTRVRISTLGHFRLALRASKIRLYCSKQLLVERKNCVVVVVVVVAAVESVERYQKPEEEVQ